APAPSSSSCNSFLRIRRVERVPSIGGAQCVDKTNFVDGLDRQFWHLAVIGLRIDPVLPISQHHVFSFFARRLMGRRLDVTCCVKANARRAALRRHRDATAVQEYSKVWHRMRSLNAFKVVGFPRFGTREAK